MTGEEAYWAGLSPDEVQEEKEYRGKCLDCGCLLPDDGYYCPCDGVDLLQEATKDERIHN